MIEEENDPIDTITVDVLLEVMYKGRQEPMFAPATFKINSSHVEIGSEIESLMNVVLFFIVKELRDGDDPRLILSDKNFNKTILIKKEIQAITIISPSKERIVIE